MSYSWQCPYCNHHTTITGGDECVKCFEHGLYNSDDIGRYKAHFIVCPNAKCKRVSLNLTLFRLQDAGEMLRRGHVLGDSITLNRNYPTRHKFRLLPRSLGKQFSNYVPQTIREDYEEACLIKQDSPKSAATLARRCLQAILLDFYEVKSNSIAKQIEKLSERNDIPSDFLEIFDVIRKYGNIASHPERDINLIMDIEEGEADVLIACIENVIEQTYIRRYEDKKNSDKIKSMRDKISKKQQGNKQGVKKDAP